MLLSRSATEALLAGERVDGPTLIGLGDSADYPASFQLTKQVVVHVPASTIDHRPYNVVALLEGSDPVLRNEYITIESHLDGAVGTRTVDGDGIYNSADDNASGSAANLAIAEHLITAPRPKRSIILSGTAARNAACGELATSCISRRFRSSESSRTSTST